jgi:hypothetical protein
LKRARPKKQTPSRPAPRRAPALRSWLLALGAGAVLAFAGWALRPGDRTTQAIAPPAAPWGSAALAMGPVEAYANGVALVDSGHAYASLPYMHRAAEAPGAPWQAWRTYASALHNVAMTGAADPLSEAEPAPRSSFERVRMMRMALERIDRAIALTQTPAERAIAQLTRAQFLRTWGFSWDALQDFHMAGELDPSWADQGPFYAALMRHPLRADPGLPSR